MIVARFIVNIFLTIDQALNTLLLGHPDETLSSRLGRTIKGRHRYFWVSWFRMLVDTIFFFDVDVESETGRIIRHCEKSVMPLEQQNFRNFDYEIWSWSKEGT